MLVLAPEGRSWEPKRLAESAEEMEENTQSEGSLPVQARLPLTESLSVTFELPLRSQARFSCRW